MNKLQKNLLKYFLIVLGAVFLIVHLFPFFINGEHFRGDICESVSKATNLNVDIKKIKFSPVLFFKAKVMLENPVIKTKEGKDVFVSEKTSISVDLLPLLMKKVQLSKIELFSPSVYIVKKQNGKFEFEPDDQSSFTPLQEAEQGFQVVLDGMDVIIKDYKLKYQDNSLYPLANAKAKGNKIVIKNYNSKAGTMLVIDGIMAVNNQRCLNYDIKSTINLPEFLAYQKEVNSLDKKDKNSFNALEQIYKNSIKADMKADFVMKTPQDITGWINVDKFSMKVNGKKLPESFCHLKAEKGCFAANSKIFVSDNSFIGLVGEFGDDLLDCNLQVPKMQLADFENFAKSLLKLSGASFKELEQFKTRGELVCDLRIKTNLKNIKSSGYLKVNNAQIDCYKGLLYIENLNSNINLNDNNVIISDTKGKIYGNNFDIFGKIDSKANTDITISAPDISLFSIFNCPNLKEQMKAISDIKGKVKACVKLSGKLYKINYNGFLMMEDGSIKLNQFPLKMTFPFAKMDMNNQTNILNIPNCFINNSKLKLTGNISLDKLDSSNITINGRISVADIAKITSSSFMGKGVVPVVAKLKYEDNSPKIHAQILNTPNNNLLIEGLNGNSVLNCEALFQNNKITFQNIGLYKTTEQMLLGDMDSNIKKKAKIATLSGGINSKKAHFEDVKLKIFTPIKLSVPVGTGAYTQVLGDVILKGSCSSPQISGDFVLQNTVIPNIKAVVDKANISFKNKKIVADISNFKAGKSDMNIQLLADGAGFSPFIIENITINSSLFDADEMLSLLSKMMPEPAPVVYSLKRSNTLHSSPVIIKDGKFVAKNFIINKMPCYDMASSIKHNKYNLFSAPNLSTMALKGKITGDVSCDLVSSLTSCNLMARNISVADFSKYFLGANLGTCSGVASSDIKIKFKGSSTEEIMKSLEGKAVVNAKNGEMGNIGRLDYYLRAANIVSNNIIAVSLNKIINGIKLKRTGEYGKAYGELSFSKGGVMRVDYFKTEGPRLSLYMTGYINTISLDSSLNVFGRMSEEVVDVLGPIGDFSIQDAIKKVSFLNSLTQYTVSLLEANISETQRKQIPPLTISGAKSQEFSSRIDGNLTKPSSVKSFRWIRTGAEL